MIAASDVCKDVADEVRASLQRLEAEAGAGVVLWAVRSSAVGEDSDDLSAAGQNATFLGCRGIDGVLDGVRRCWASLFTMQSVQYRRQYAQPVDAPMAVVVQRMVDAHSAGVLFTCDPASGDPRSLLITANYGLGESVVSAAVDPDTLVVRRDMAGRMHVAERRCGDKQHRVVLAADGGVREEKVTKGADGALCISDDEALRLARVGARLERVFGGARDVEWAFVDGHLYLLQSRPVTALFNWTDFELCHELDGPVVSDEDVISFANVGEVLPGASSVLSQTTLGKAINVSTGRAVEKDKHKDYFYGEYIPSTHHHVALNVLSLLLSHVGPELDIASQVLDLTLYGHRATTPRMHRAAIQRNGLNMDAKTKMLLTFEALSRAWNGRRNVRLSQELTRSVDVHERAAQESTARGVLAHIHRSLPTLVESLTYHSYVSNASSFSQIIAVSTLTEGAKELNVEHITDVGSMLSCTGADVVSAGIPKSIQAIADAVRLGERWQDFVALRPEEGMDWLQQHCPPAYKLANDFLEKYGCRVVREFDVRTVTWEEEPQRLIASLQSLVGSHSGKTPDRPAAVSIEDIIKRLKSPKKGFTRFLLRYLLPWFQSCVANREFTKEATIRLLNKMRRAYRRLGVLLEEEGLIPDKDLLCCLTYNELYLLVESQRQPDPTLIAKARRRKRCWPEWDILLFPEIIHGVPEPIQTESEESAGGRVVAQGTPVSESSVTARACVVLSLDGDQGVSQLRHGDILITHSTDVGWSPYFPMLGGVVTELGGLISHGAVVAREYGLPCLVGVQGATRTFKTGDTVKIDGKTGALSKVNEVESKVT